MVLQLLRVFLGGLGLELEAVGVGLRGAKLVPRSLQAALRHVKLFGFLLLAPGDVLDFLLKFVNLVVNLLKRQ